MKNSMQGRPIWVERGVEHYPAVLVRGNDYHVGDCVALRSPCGGAGASQAQETSDKPQSPLHYGLIRDIQYNFFNRERKFEIQRLFRSSEVSKGRPLPEWSPVVAELKSDSRSLFYSFKRETFEAEAVQCRVKLVLVPPQCKLPNRPHKEQQKITQEKEFNTEEMMFACFVYDPEADVSGVESLYSVTDGDFTPDNQKTLDLDLGNSKHVWSQFSVRPGFQIPEKWAQWAALRRQAQPASSEEDEWNKLLLREEDEGEEGLEKGGEETGSHEGGEAKEGEEEERRVTRSRKRQQSQSDGERGQKHRRRVDETEVRRGGTIVERIRRKMGMPGWVIDSEESEEEGIGEVMKVGMGVREGQGLKRGKEEASLCEAMDTRTNHMPEASGDYRGLPISMDVPSKAEESSRQEAAGPPAAKDLGAAVLPRVPRKPARGGPGMLKSGLSVLGASGAENCAEAQNNVGERATQGGPCAPAAGESRPGIEDTQNGIKQNRTGKAWEEHWKSAAAAAVNRHLQGLITKDREEHIVKLTAALLQGTSGGEAKEAKELMEGTGEPQFDVPWEKMAVDAAVGLDREAFDSVKIGEPTRKYTEKLRSLLPPFKANPCCAASVVSGKLRPEQVLSMSVGELSQMKG